MGPAEEGEAEGQIPQIQLQAVGEGDIGGPDVESSFDSPDVPRLKVPLFLECVPLPGGRFQRRQLSLQIPQLLGLRRNGLLSCRIGPISLLPEHTEPIFL